LLCVNVANSEFRQDINALRAIAVASVMLFHFRVPGFAGGFAGVDIFFVISGYLMTSIIATARARNEFTVARFLRARAARILPALFVLVVAVVLVAALLLPPVDLRSIARHGTYALMFWSNQVLAGEAGYFAPGSDENPFLHTWSLSVEWQFYLLLPFALMGLGKLGRQGWSVLVIGLIGSAAFASLEQDANVRFFGLSARAWELAVGGLTYLATTTPTFWSSLARWRRIVALSGLALVALAVAFVDSNMKWPMPWAMLPVVGTALIIAARHEFRAYAWAPVQALGRWSYSVYLWHWPIVVALRLTHRQSEVNWMALGFVLSTLFGYLSYRWIEAPARVAFRTSTWPVISWAASAWLLAVTGTVLLVKADGWPQRQPAMADSLQALRAAEADWTFPGGCVNWKSRAEPVLCSVHPEAVARKPWLVVGDSHAQHLWPYFDARAVGRRVDFMTAGGCPPLPGMNQKTPGYDCQRVFDRAQDLVRTGNYERVIVASWWDGYFIGDAAVCVWKGGRCGATISTIEDARLAFDAVARTWQTWRALGVQVYAVLPEPRLRVSQPRELARRQYLQIDEASARAVSLREYLRLAGPVRAEVTRAALLAGAVLLDPAAQLCDARTCKLEDDQGAPIFRDGSHFRATWAAQSMHYLDDALLAEIGRPVADTAHPKRLP
jgi:peptidoglycan/LPS O-acetylase OafA/YrhL